MEKSGLKFVESMVDQVMQIKLTELLADYLLSVILRDKAGIVMSRIFMLRAQFILLIALLKIVKMGTKFMTWKRRKVSLFKL
jgi:alpha-D-ribose 1-methylphosphonate 5-triphosphate synthase subunit PhnI